MKNTVPLKKNYEFSRVYKRGRYYVGRFIVIYILKNNKKANRLGITTSKKVGKAVKRNRFRRLIKENYRFYEEYLEYGYDIVFIARGTESMPDFKDINKEMKYLFRKLNILNRERWKCVQNS